MREPPKNTIALEAIKSWKITASLYIGLFWLITIAGTIVIFIYRWSIWISIVAFILGIIAAYLFIFLLPKVRWRRWRYEIFDQEIYIQHGILIVTKTIVPMIRVQHVDTKQGPILKRFDLASVTISTAATTHVIPALLEEDASELRDRISMLARVEEVDV